MSDLDRYLYEFRELKNKWFNALTTDDIELQKLLEKQMKQIESKIDIELDGADPNYRRIVKYECQPHLQWIDYLDSLRK